MRPFAADGRTPGRRERDDRLKRHPARSVRHDAQSRRTARDALDAANMDERGMAERRQPRNPLPQRKFERAHPKQIGSHVQDALAAVDGQTMSDGAQRVGIPPFRRRRVPRWHELKPCRSLGAPRNCATRAVDARPCAVD